MDLVRGIVCVVLGAGCYGVLSTCVKLAYQDGYSPGEVLSSQFIVGTVVLGLLVLGARCRGEVGAVAAATRSRILRLVAGGSSIGFTGTSYYLSVAHGAVSTAIVLLMQSVWMGVLLDAGLTRTWPSLQKIAASIMVIVGTLLATNMLWNPTAITAAGAAFGLLAAVSYTAVMWVSKNIEPNVDVISRSFWMIVGGMVATAAITLPQLYVRFDMSVFWTWGWSAALLGTILPPFLFNKGVPATGVGLATILSSVELPVAIVMPGVVLNEGFSSMQWIGVAAILGAIAPSNVQLRSSPWAWTR